MSELIFPAEQRRPAAAALASAAYLINAPAFCAIAGGVW
jgi:hypothetical protein